MPKSAPNATVFRFLHVAWRPTVSGTHLWRTRVPSVGPGAWGARKETPFTPNTKCKAAKQEGQARREREREREKRCNQTPRYQFEWFQRQLVVCFLNKCRFVSSHLLPFILGSSFERSRENERKRERERGGEN